MSSLAGVVRVAAGSPPGGFVSSDPAAYTGGVLSPPLPLPLHLGLGGEPIELYKPPALGRPAMSRAGLRRVDIDTRHLYHRRLRQLQTNERNKWPTYYAAWMALLCESVAAEDRLTLDEAWLPALPCRINSARSALELVGLVDQDARIPLASWEDWVRPALDRLRKVSEGGIEGNRRRWSIEHTNGTEPLSPPDQPPIAPRSGTESSNQGIHTIPNQGNQPPDDSSQAKSTNQELPQTMMGFRPRAPQNDGPGFWQGKGLHDGRHGETCSVCAPLAAEYAKRQGKTET